MSCRILHRELCDADFARNLERERDSAKTLNRSLLDQLEAKDAQIEAMRNAIRFTLTNHNLDPEACLDKLKSLLP